MSIYDRDWYRETQKQREGDIYSFNNKETEKRMGKKKNNRIADPGAKSCLISIVFILVMPWVIMAICSGGPEIIEFFKEYAPVAIGKVEKSANEYFNKLKGSTVSSPQRDENGLFSENYDLNGWAYVNGNWVSNPRPGAFVRYADAQRIATASKSILVWIDNNDTPTKDSRNFSSIEETYPLLRRVAEDLQYSDIEALQDSFRKYKPLPANHYYELDGKRFYSNQDLFDYEIQKATEWGNKNDQNNDGEINCVDYAELFYKYASDAGYHVRYISNSGLNHAFNQAKIQNEWVSIEPQSAEVGLERRLPLESERFPDYNPMYDKIQKEN
jgi:hypothetical protein